MLRRILLNERIIFFLILINAVLIALLYFPKFKNNEQLIFLDHLFVIVFLLEILFKIKDQGLRAFWESNWNRFETMLVLFSVPAIFHSFIPTAEVSVLVVFRLLRIFRVIRFFQFIPRIDTIFSGLRRALKSSVFVFFTLITLNFLFALLACQFFKDIAPELFGDPMISFYSIFQSFTIEGWNEIPKLLVDRIEAQGYSEPLVYFYSWACRLFFVLVVLTGGMLGMSLANAIFVDEMTMDNNKNLEDKIDQLSEQIHLLQRQIAERDEEQNQFQEISVEEEN